MRNTVAVLFTTLRTLSLRKLLRVMKLVLGHPLFSVMGFFATVKAFAFARKHFPETHNSSGVGNAYRHALWSALIAAYCAKISSAEKAVRYALRMTNLHEELFPNAPMETSMDLHNNGVGISVFKAMLKSTHRQFFETTLLSEEILRKVETAEVLSDQGKAEEEVLVYLNS